LGGRDRTVAQVRGHLARKRVEPGTAELVLEALQRDRVLDDAGYARRYAEDRRRLDGWGAERIERSLATAGIARDAIAAALTELSGESETDAALQVLTTRVRIPPRDDAERQRALALLVRRGYELEVAYDAVRAFETRAAA
jgi:regulatory protein